MEQDPTHAVGHKHKFVIAVLVFILNIFLVFGKQQLMVLLVMDETEIIGKCVDFILTGQNINHFGIIGVLGEHVNSPVVNPDAVDIANLTC